MHSKQSFSVPRTGSSAGAGGNQYLRKRFALRSPSFPPVWHRASAPCMTFCARSGVFTTGAGSEGRSVRFLRAISFMEWDCLSYSALCNTPPRCLVCVAKKR